MEELSIGDYIVHEHYGIGIFRGITGGAARHCREYILLQYAGTDRLYLPVENWMYCINTTPLRIKTPLKQAGGTEWERTGRVAQSIQEMAEKLLALYASRQAKRATLFQRHPWQQQFEDDFIYRKPRIKSGP